MSQRRASNKRKGNNVGIAMDDEEEERKEDTRSRLEPVPAAVVSSSSAAASASHTAAASASSSSSAASVASSSVSSTADPENVECVICDHGFECADDAPHLPRTLPCGHLLCAACIRKQLSLTSGRVQCPFDQQHGEQKIRIAQSKSPAAADGPAPAQSEVQGAAARAEPTIEDCLRQLPPAKELIAAIRIQHQLLTQLKQHRVRCSYPDCAADVTHFCADCLDLCSTHERKRHSIEPFKSHKQTTMPIAQKSAFLQQQQQSKLAGPAAKIRSQATALLLQQQQLTTVAEDELKALEAQTRQQLQKKRRELELQTQLQLQQLQKERQQVEAKKRQEVETKQKALGALKQTTDAMQKADDCAVLEMEADRLAAEAQAAAPMRLVADSTILSKLDDKRVGDLQTLLGPARSLSKATLIYRASRDGFEADDWWRQCGGKSRLLTLVQVKRNGFVFAAFTPFRWPASDPNAGVAVADPSGETCIVSLVNAHGRVVKLRLKASEKEHAGSVWAGFGPFFGRDLGLMYSDRSADTPNGNLTQPDSFEFDSVADGGKSIGYDKTLLAGDDGQNNEYVLFAAAEIETWQL